MSLAAVCLSCSLEGHMARARFINFTPGQAHELGLLIKKTVGPGLPDQLDSRPCSCVHSTWLSQNLKPW